MDTKIQELTDKIYKEGVEKGNEEAGRIIAEANAQKDTILKDAEAEAKRIVAAAEKIHELRNQLLLTLRRNRFYCSIHNQFFLSAFRQICPWIRPLPIDAHLEMGVRPGGAPGAAGEGDDISRLHSLTDSRQKLRAVTV